MLAIQVALRSAAVLAVAGCASLQVQTDFNPQAPIAQLGTDCWGTQADATDGHPAVHSALVAARIQHAVDSTLQHMGYQQVTDGTPDFTVTYRISTDEKTRVDPGYGYSRYGLASFGHFGSPYFGYPYGRFGYSPYYGGGGARKYVEATLVLDVTDATTNELIWRGWGWSGWAGIPTPRTSENSSRRPSRRSSRGFPRRP
jgi:hypothetical protein